MLRWFLALQSQFVSFFVLPDLSHPLPIKLWVAAVAAAVVVARFAVTCPNCRVNMRHSHLCSLLHMGKRPKVKIWADWRVKCLAARREDTGENWESFTVISSRIACCCLVTARVSFRAGGVYRSRLMFPPWVINYMYLLIYNASVMAQFVHVWESAYTHVF